MNKAITSNDIYEYINYLRLPGIREILENTVETCRSQGVGYLDFLQILFEYETNLRKQNRIERLLRASNLSLSKTFDCFEMNRLSLKTRQKVTSLIDGSFIDRRENVLAFGLPGTGKTHLLSAIAHEQIKKGRHFLFISCSLLVQRLLIAKKELMLEKYLRKLSKFECILVDDIGYVQQTREEMEVFFTFLAERYERGSVMITSNLQFSKWENIFKDPMTTAAAIDRLVHHSIILELNMKSYRTEKALEKKGE